MIKMVFSLVRFVDLETGESQFFNVINMRLSHLQNCSL
jgi:hypothetical protein